MKKCCLLALTILVSATSVSAADNEQTGQDQSATSGQTDLKAVKEKKKQRLICRSSRVTGSLTRVNRTCHTKEQWDQIANQTRESMDYIEHRSTDGYNTKIQTGPGS